MTGHGSRKTKRRSEKAGEHSMANLRRVQARSTGIGQRVVKQAGQLNQEGREALIKQVEMSKASEKEI